MPFEAGVAPVPQEVSHTVNPDVQGKEADKGCVCCQPETMELPRAGITAH